MDELLQAFRDPEVDEVLVSGGGAFAVRGLRAVPFETPFASEDAFLDELFDFAAAQGTRLDPVLGSAGGMWRQTYRWHVVLPPLSRDGPLFSLRRHRFDAVGLERFAGAVDEVRRFAAEGVPTLIAGPTGSGKTTLLAALLRAVAPTDRIVVVEALAELPQLNPYTVRLCARDLNLEGRGAVGVERLVAEALRLRPDRLVIGEIRAREAKAFVHAAQAGHGGVIATIHAGSPEEARARLAMLGGLETLTLRVAVAQLVRGRPPRIVAVSGA